MIKYLNPNYIEGGEQAKYINLPIIGLNASYTLDVTSATGTLSNEIIQELTKNINLGADIYVKAPSGFNYYVISNTITDSNIVLQGYFNNRFCQTNITIVSGAYELTNEKNVITTRVLLKDNGTTEYTPTEDYHPSTKKYVDDAVATIQTQLNTLVSGDASSAIESFNEIIAFLASIEDTETLEGIIAGLNQSITNVSNRIPTSLSQLTNDNNTVTDASYVHTDNNFTTEYKNKLDGIASGAEANVNADWNASSGDAQILNKPNLHAVATSGAYSDLSGTPALATVATSGSYNDLSDQPDIPNSISDLTQGILPESQGGTGTTSLANVTVGNATKATQDASGNVITTYYAKQSDMDFFLGVNSVTTLANLPITKRSIVATVTTDTDLSLASALPLGKELYIRVYNNGSSAITQPIPNSGNFVSMSGTSFSIPVHSFIEMSIWCYATNSYSIRVGEVIA